MTTKKCTKCETEKEISLFGLQRGKIRSQCKSCINKKRNDRYKEPKAPQPEGEEDELTKFKNKFMLLKKEVRAKNEEIFLQKELIKKLTKELKKQDIPIPVLDTNDHAYMYQFLYC